MAKNRYQINPETIISYRIADRYVPRLRKALIDGIRRYGIAAEIVVRKSLSNIFQTEPAVTALNTAMETRAAAMTMQQDLAKVFNALRRRTIDETIKSLGYISKAEVDVDLLDRDLAIMVKPELYDEAITTAELEAAELVTVITETQMLGIREIIANGVASMEHPRVIARNVRNMGIGLAERGPHTYARVQRYMESQLAAGVSDKLVERRVKRFHDKLVRDRSESIARTEMIGAQSKARHSVWIAEKNAGLFNEAYRVWVAGVGPRTCPECIDKDGDIAPVGKPYDDGAMEPPLHPMCRCTEGLYIP